MENTDKVDKKLKGLTNLEIESQRIGKSVLKCEIFFYLFYNNVEGQNHRHHKKDLIESLEIK